MGKNQRQHFVSEFLLKNFTDNDNKTHIYKCENDNWTEHNINNTGYENLTYGSFDCSLEKYFGIIENRLAPVLTKYLTLNKKDKEYMKIFILTMAFRSPSKNQIITEKYENLMEGLKKEISEEDICSYFEDRRKEQNSWLVSLDDDPEMKEIVNALPDSFDDSDNSKVYPMITKGLLQVLPKISERFEIEIFESDNDLVIGETPTLSVNLITNEVKINGEEAGLIHENVIYWLPIAHNKVVFMYTVTNVVPIKERKLRKEDVDILNYYQIKKNPYFYSRINGINIPKLSKNIIWINDFNYIFRYKNLS